MLSFLAFTSVNAKKGKDEPKEVKYRRSSLHMVLIESENFPKKESVLKAYTNAPFPDKYNEHSLDGKSFAPQKYPVTDDDRKAAGTDKSGAGKILSKMGSDATSGILDKEASDYPIIIQKYINQNKIANQLVAKWFDRQPDGTFDTKLISERGFYNASEMEANVAKGAEKGRSSLGDAGEELIKNTFVIFTKLNFVSNEKVAAVVRDAGKIAATKNIKIPALLDKANKGIDIAYEKAKEGYSVWTTAYLYRLKWNDSISTVFYNDMWIDKNNIDAKKKLAFDNSNIFELELIGDNKVSNLVLFSLKEKRTEEQIVEMATVRNIDAVYAKLQKKYEVFRPKVPLFGNDPITSKIGMKEGLEGGEKFEILEQTINQETGRTEYKRKGTIKVNSDLIWDNRYNAGEEQPIADASKDGVQKPVIDKTTFKGKGKKLYPGMLIRQID